MKVDEKVSPNVGEQFYRGSKNILTFEERIKLRFQRYLRYDTCSLVTKIRKNWKNYTRFLRSNDYLRLYTIFLSIIFVTYTDPKRAENFNVSI